jgi:hypothetical protein
VASLCDSVCSWPGRALTLSGPDAAGDARCRDNHHQVEDDRVQISAVIQQLDEKKRLALEETWKQVGGVAWPVAFARHASSLARAA